MRSTLKRTLKQLEEDIKFDNSYQKEQFAEILSREPDLLSEDHLREQLLEEHRQKEDEENKEKLEKLYDAMKENAIRNNN